MLIFPPLSKKPLYLTVASNFYNSGEQYTIDDIIYDSSQLIIKEFTGTETNTCTRRLLAAKYDIVLIIVMTTEAFEEVFGDESSFEEFTEASSTSSSLVTGFEETLENIDVSGLGISDGFGATVSNVQTVFRTTQTKTGGQPGNQFDDIFYAVIFAIGGTTVFLVFCGYCFAKGSGADNFNYSSLVLFSIYTWDF